MTVPFQPAPFSTDPVDHMKAIDADAQWLDWLTKALDDAVDALDAAEAAWNAVRDPIAESLKDDMTAEGRKGDPAEHWIETHARRADRLAFQNMRQAERLVKKLEKQVQSVGKALSGRQTALNGLKGEPMQDGSSSNFFDRPRRVA